MSNLFHNLSTAIQARLNDASEKAIQNPAGARQYVRELETALEELQHDQAVAQARCRTLTREITDLGIKIKRNTDLIKQLQAGNGPNKDAIIRSKASEVVLWQKELEDKQGSLSEQNKSNIQLDQNVVVLEVKHREALNAIRGLEQLQHDTDAKKHEAAAAKHVSSVVNGLSNVNIGNITQKMHEENDVAAVEAEQAMGGISIEGNAEHEADVDAFLANLQSGTAGTAA